MGYPLLPKLYYLQNFKSALQWLDRSYGDLLSGDEAAFIREFSSLPSQSQALLVRLIMRKGQLFRASKISYSEIDDIASAMCFLVDLGWIDPHPRLALADLFKVVNRAEVNEIFPALPRGLTKGQSLEALSGSHGEARRFEDWRGAACERVYSISIAPLCTRLRLLFFGNFRQDWSEFVLADLGILKYEAVALSPACRAFHARADIESFYVLHECEQRLHEQAPLADVMARLPPGPLGHEWLEGRRAKLIYRIAEAYQRAGDCDSALSLYGQCSYPGARMRALRILEIAGQYAKVQSLAASAAAAPESDAEVQWLPRILKRVGRRLGTAPQSRTQPAHPERIDLIVPAPKAGAAVEMIALERLRAHAAPVYYVENTLINGLFGLLFWDVIFAPVRGAFFHPFHFGPVDLFSSTFACRRAGLIETCFARLDSGAYSPWIKETFRSKQGVQSPFVSWRHLDTELIDLALDCIPAIHLRGFFTRLLSNLRQNRSGLPDLLQFWVTEKRYRMIEVKGPGDRLQDNQRRWMDFCLKRQIPLALCHVRW